MLISKIVNPQSIPYLEINYKALKTFEKKEKFSNKMLCFFKDLKDETDCRGFT